MTTTPTPTYTIPADLAATDKQVDYLTALVRDRQVSFDIPENLSARDASTLIEQAKAAPMRTKAEGYYIHGGDVYKVKANQAMTGTYAQRLVIEGDAARRTARWKYEQGTVVRLTEKLPRAVAVEFGQITGICVVCAKALRDDELSAGIGAVCAGRLEE